MGELLLQIVKEGKDFCLDEIIRHGAQHVLAAALEQEVNDAIERCKHLKDDKGHRLIVRNGKAKTRQLTCGSGTLEVNAPRVNDRREGHKFTSEILPPYLRRTPAVDSVIPALYLKGISGNTFEEALQALLGERASGLNKSSVAAMKQRWCAEMEAWKHRPIEEEFAYLWADGVFVNVRLGDNKRLCLLVVIGVTASGEKKLLAVEACYRESADAWEALFRDLVSRGLSAPLLIVGDGGRGLWAAVDRIDEFAETKRQRCWFHKMENVLDKLPDNLQPQAKSKLRGMMHASHKRYAEKALRDFKSSFHEKYPKAVSCLENDWEELTAFYTFPPKHWRHLKTTNPIESIFSPLKGRLRATKGAGSERMAEAMAFKLLTTAQKNWKKISGYEEIPKLMTKNLYKNGEVLDATNDQRGYHPIHNFSE